MKSVICALLCSVLANVLLFGAQNGHDSTILRKQQVYPRKSILAMPKEKRVDARIYPVRDRIECESLNGTWDLDR